ncbi:hypothetical protein U9M48_042140 [Paspalum notatum var. saurae]|uniref:Secreted protein n=1 Tax=Paspalum notatum var. saurae TaxID=547442 RepID=A0AAQ3UQ91_PASNO
MRVGGACTPPSRDQLPVPFAFLLAAFLHAATCKSSTIRDSGHRARRAASLSVNTVSSLSPAPHLRGPDPSLAGDQPCDVVALHLCPSVGRRPVQRGYAAPGPSRRTASSPERPRRSSLLSTSSVTSLRSRAERSVYMNQEDVDT